MTHSESFKWGNYFEEITSLKENIIFVKLIETFFDGNIIVSFTEFQCQGTDTANIRMKAFDIHIQCKLLRK